MDNNFKDILTSMLAELDKGMSVEEIIANKIKEGNLTEESQAKVTEAVGYVDKLDVAKQKLAVALKKGTSRQEWLESQIENITDALPEELQEKANVVLDKATKQYFDNMVK